MCKMFKTLLAGYLTQAVKNKLYLYLFFKNNGTNFFLSFFK